MEEFSIRDIEVKDFKERVRLYEEKLVEVFIYLFFLKEDFDWFFLENELLVDINN